MPYKKSYRYKKRYPRRRRAPAKSSWSSTAYTAARALTMATRLAGIINSELKNYDTTTNAAQPSSTVAVQQSFFNSIAQGDSNNNVDGNSILLKSIQVKGTITLNASATTTRVRIIVVRDTRPQIGTSPVITDILNTNSINSFLNIDNQSGRFKVLKDKRYVVDANMKREVQISMYRKTNFHVKFNDSVAPIMNDVHWFLLSDEATNVPSIALLTRVRYYDN